MLLIGITSTKNYTSIIFFELPLTTLGAFFSNIFLLQARLIYISNIVK